MSESTNNATVTDSLTVAADQAAFESWLRTFPPCLTPFAVWCGGRDDLRASAAASSRTQHDADSKELRSLCVARDAARKEVTELRAQLEEERARNVAAQAMPKVAGYLSKTGHGSYFRETITPSLAELEWCGMPMWRPVAFVDAAPHLAVIPGADPK